jgi:hypothetical protein
MMTYCQDGIYTELSEEFVELSKRKRELDTDSEIKPDLRAALYDGLAIEFDAGYWSILSGVCARRAAQIRKMPQ